MRRKESICFFDGGSTAGFVKQLKQNNGYVYLVVEELVSFPRAELGLGSVGIFLET